MPTIVGTVILVEAYKATIQVWTSIVALNYENVASVFSARLYKLNNSWQKCFLKRLLRANFGLSHVPSTLPVTLTSSA
jgi:hypothetical protein